MCLRVGQTAVATANAPYFGRSKVQYEKFDWRMLEIDRFDLHFYPAESITVYDAGRRSERWYTRPSDIFRHQFDRKSIAWYADHPDFQQTNVIAETLSQVTATLPSVLRVGVRFTGMYNDDEHLTRHELVRVFQYNIAAVAPRGVSVGRQRTSLLARRGNTEYLQVERDHKREKFGFVTRSALYRVAHKKTGRCIVNSCL